MTEHVIPLDVIYPRDDAHRYRLYGRIGDELTVLACAPEPGGIGQAIVTLHDDAKQAGGRLADHGQIGVLDVVAGEWVLLPFNRGERTTPDGH